MKSQYITILAALVLSATLSSLHVQSSQDSEPTPESSFITGWRVRTAPWSFTEAVGLKNGDIVLKVNGTPFSGTRDDFREIRRYAELGKSILVRFERNGEIYEREGIIDLSKTKRPDDYEFGKTLLNSNPGDGASEARP